jgi:hypothetical protein
LKKTKKILVFVSVFLVLISNIGYAVSSVYCEMTKNFECECSMFDELNQTGNSVNISSESGTCCKVEVISVTNSSDFESNNNKIVNITVSQIITGNLIQNTDYVTSNGSMGEILIFYSPAVNIPIMYSSLLI